YSLRFPGDELSTFLAGAWATLPTVVSGQMIGLAAARAYSRRMNRLEWLTRVVVGATVGTAASMAVVGVLWGFAGVSRIAFVADAMLLSTAAVTWRGLWALKARMRARAVSLPIADDLVDRAAQRMTIGATLTSMYRYRALIK